MAFGEPDKVLSRFPPFSHGRAALALVYAISDSQAREYVVPFGKNNVAATRDTEIDYFKKLLSYPDVAEAWSSYTDVKDHTKFPRKLASGTAPLNAFRHYLLQDAIYLEYYVRVRLQAIAAPNAKATADQLRTFANEIISGLGDSAGARASCQELLGIPASDVDDERNHRRSQELENSVQFYKDVIEGKADDTYNKPINPWLDIHFALLPCIKGYYAIATNIKDPVQNTLYYPLWIADNQDADYVEDYDHFIRCNIKQQEPDDDDWKHWAKIFSQACRHEEAFFNLLLKNDTIYNIVRQGKEIQIHPHARATEYLAIDDNNDIVVKDQRVKWKWANNVDGYTIWTEKGADTRYLTADASTKSVSAVADASQATKWDINFIMPAKGEPYQYQLFVAGHLELTLHVDQNTKKVTLEENTFDAEVMLVAAKTTWNFKE